MYKVIEQFMIVTLHQNKLTQVDKIFLLLK